MSTAGGSRGAHWTIHPAALRKADPIVQIDHYNSLIFLNGPRDVAAHAEAVEQLQGVALSEGDSLNFIASIQTELEG